MSMSKVKNIPAFLGILFTLTPFTFTDATHAQPVPTTGTVTLQFVCGKKLSEPEAPGALPGTPFPVGDQFWPLSCDNLRDVLGSYCETLDKAATQQDEGKKCREKSCKELAKLGKTDKKYWIIPVPPPAEPNCRINADESWCNCKTIPKLPMPSSDSTTKVGIVIDNEGSVQLSIDEMIDILSQSL